MLLFRQFSDKELKEKIQEKSWLEIWVLLLQKSGGWNFC